MRLVLLIAAAAACSSTALGGTSALFNHVAAQAAGIPAVRLA